MNDFEPIAVALKFGFIAVLYLFLLWVSRSALRELRRTGGVPAGPDETGIHLERRPVAGGQPGDASLVVERGGGLTPGERFDLFGGVTLGRSGQADIRLDDPYASQVHARIYAHAGAYYVEDLNSTNGTYLNGATLSEPRPLEADDILRIGDAELRYDA